MIYVLKIKKEKIFGTLDEINIQLKLKFKNFDYMIGYLDGYLFDKKNYNLSTLKEFEIKINNNIEPLNNIYYIKFLEVLED